MINGIYRFVDGSKEENSFSEMPSTMTPPPKTNSLNR